MNEVVMTILSYCWIFFGAWYSYRRSTIKRPKYKCDRLDCMFFLYVGGVMGLTAPLIYWMKDKEHFFINNT